MAMKLYVGNLPHEMTEEQLNTLFSEAGYVASAKIITDRQTGQPRGFGFVEMETKLEGQKAISMLNGREVEGRPLAVNEARPQAERRLWWGRRPRRRLPLSIGIQAAARELPAVANLIIRNISEAACGPLFF